MAGGVTVYDCRTGWTVNGGDSNAQIDVGNFDSVVAVINDGDRSGGYHFTDVSSDYTETIRQMFVDGRVAPGTAVISDSKVYFTQIFEGCSSNINNNAADPGDNFFGVGMTTEPVSDPAADNRGEFEPETSGQDGRIIYGSAGDGLDYAITVQGLNNYWLMSSQMVNVGNTTPPEYQQINVDQGGTLRGTITYAIGGAPVSNVLVSAGGASDMTDAQGAFNFDLPPGEVTIFVGGDGGGAMNFGTTIVAGDDITRNFQQGPWSGEVLNVGGDAIENATIMGTTAEMTDNDGKYTAKFFEGTNWVCVNPNSADNSTYEFKCFYDIVVTPEDF